MPSNAMTTGAINMSCLADTGYFDADDSLTCVFSLIFLQSSQDRALTPYRMYWRRGMEVFTNFITVLFLFQAGNIRQEILKQKDFPLGSNRIANLHRVQKQELCSVCFGAAFAYMLSVKFK